ncbi:MAG: DUF1080 domain-containing protein [Candidatus Aminicenantes bacterium]|nr:DUF1080 domain-containing protein [Candidatus Aminicenantes bacterium]
MNIIMEEKLKTLEKNNYGMKGIESLKDYSLSHGKTIEKSQISVCSADASLNDIKNYNNNNNLKLIRNTLRQAKNFLQKSFICILIAISLVLPACSLLTPPASEHPLYPERTTALENIIGTLQKPLSLQVEAWLRQLPAANQDEAEKIFSEMLNGGSPVVQELCRRIAIPGEADDSLVRYAVDGLVTQAGKPGFENFREKLAENLLKLALRPINVEIKKFLLEEAQFIISKKHLSLLRPHLKSPELAEYTVKAMLRVQGPELEKILVEDFDRIPAQSRKPVIQALGRMKSKKAVKQLKVLARSPDHEIKILALTALVEIADPSVEPLLSSIPTLSTTRERLETLALYLRFARRLAENGFREKASEIAEKSVEILTDQDEVALRCQALSLLVELEGEKAIPALIKGIWSEQPAYRQQALNLAKEYGWPSFYKTLINSLPSLPAENKAAVIELLGQAKGQGQVSAEIIEPFLEAQEEVVRLAAIRAFFNLKKEEATGRLLSMLNNSEAEVRLILSLLKTLKPEIYVSKIREDFPQLTETSQVAVLTELRDFLNQEWKKQIISATEAENPQLKKVATDCLAQVVEREDLLWLVDKLTELDDPSLEAGYQKAVVDALRQIPEEDLRQKTFLEFLEKKSGKARAELIKLLPQVGGSECLRKALSLINDKNPEISAAALAVITGWPEFGAAPHMANLIKSSTDRKVRYLAFQGLARLMRSENASTEEKLNVLEEVKSLAVYPDEKNFLLMAWGSVRDIRALRELASFLGEENLKERAATLICRLARPVAGEEGLRGLETIIILKKAVALLKDNYEIEETEIYLDKLLRQEGFKPLFNRKDLYGWKGLVGDPVQRAKMKPEELQAAQQKADEEMRLHWKVVDGMLVFDGKGHNLCTAKDYCDFELFVDWKIEPGGDSGIYLRGSPQVQIWDPAQWPEGSGGLYNNQKNPNKPLKRADNPIGTWNTFYIKMVGERVTVYLNGELVVDNVVMENYWERDKPIYRCGQIELQAHNTPLYFKNIYIREIKGDNTQKTNNL